MQVTLYSKLYLEQDDSTWCARPSRRLLKNVHDIDEDNDSVRWIAVIGSSASEAGAGAGADADADAEGSAAAAAATGGSEIRIALGDPVSSAVGLSLYIPQWVLNSAGLEGTGETVNIRFERSETLAKATQLEFKVLGEIPEGIDLKDLLEEPLSQLGVLEQGQIIPAPLFDGVSLIVKSCSPAGVPVFLDGAEIALEIEADDVTHATASAHATPVVATHASSESESATEERDEDSMIPSPPIQKSQTSSVGCCGSGSRGTFVPFQGVGRRLCD
jgi:hypothetical protein